MSDIQVNIPGECLYDKIFVLSFIIYNISTNLNIVNGIFYIQAKKDSITFEWKAKEQTRKLAIDSSKPCFEVVDYSKMKQEQEKSIGTVKSISNNVLEVEVYYYSFSLL
ncbi:Uncharacterised protein [Streptococcus pneumoniae]|nr:Uncharacterised protein [Streptococcus pneumoniae]